ncbi:MULTISPECIES: hypothetical protein [unclassified Crossiella]|uniref:hypothetical protein n=1 Tax=unclassified Crossiella TaxID=2620835 RepID=UPI001FFE310E|nr:MULTISPECIES: hypothetical protein [unclassified Crossiella]MCK2240048.1 hypothetical protein [Crossiella sp. S99.2]MCK2252756.1 hypothetical protein [Crossiella sp. S99.1]
MSLLYVGLPDRQQVRDWAAESAHEVARIAAEFPVGTVVERFGNDIRKRAQSLPRTDLPQAPQLVDTFCDCIHSDRHQHDDPGSRGAPAAAGAPHSAPPCW